jgi:hypothetical protein
MPLVFVFWLVLLCSSPPNDERDSQSPSDRALAWFANHFSYFAGSRWSPNLFNEGLTTGSCAEYGCIISRRWVTVSDASTALAFVDLDARSHRLLRANVGKRTAKRSHFVVLLLIWIKLLNGPQSTKGLPWTEKLKTYCQEGGVECLNNRWKVIQLWLSLHDLPDIQTFWSRIP